MADRGIFTYNPLAYPPTQVGPFICACGAIWSMHQRDAGLCPYCGSSDVRNMTDAEKLRMAQLAMSEVELIIAGQSEEIPEGTRRFVNALSELVAQEDRHNG